MVLCFNKMFKVNQETNTFQFPLQIPEMKFLQNLLLNRFRLTIANICCTCCRTIPLCGDVCHWVSLHISSGCLSDHESTNLVASYFLASRQILPVILQSLSSPLPPPPPPILSPRYCISNNKKKVSFSKNKIITCLTVQFSELVCSIRITIISLLD